MASSSPPTGYEWFSDQIAGHHPSVVKNGIPQIGILKRPGSHRILKPCQEGSRGEREVGVYEEAGRSPSLTDLRPFLPSYHGTTPIAIRGEEVTFMTLEDVCYSYRRPVILDVKMGLVTYSPEATEAKKNSETVKYPPQATVGFRICGYRMHKEDNMVIHKDKGWGKSFDGSTVHLALAEFFSGRVDRSPVVAASVERLKKIEDWFLGQRLLHFYSSSLLFVYEGDDSLPPRVDIRMIDFSHTFPARGQLDSNYIPGLQRLIREISSLE